MGKHETGYARVARDLYPTRERWVTEALLAHVDLSGRSVWEPAAGHGDMADVLKASGADVFCSDVVKHGYTLDAVCDFTLTKPGRWFGSIVTNPPGGVRNSLAEQFVETGLRSLSAGQVLALLLPADFDSAASRRQWFADCPQFKAKIVLTKRITCLCARTGDARRQRKTTRGSCGSAPHCECGRRRSFSTHPPRQQALHIKLH